MDDENSPTVGSLFSFSDGLLQPYMGLLEINQPNDPWTYKAYDPHYALYTGGGSYASYLKDDTDGRKRRDTNIMGQNTQSHHLLTPGMLERLLRIKNEFQRRFPQLYKGMLNHHTNRTRVEVKPPLLVRKKDKGKPMGKLITEKPVYELGAAEKGLFDDKTEELDEELDVADEEDLNQEVLEPKESNDISGDNKDMKEDDNDKDVDYFNFDDDDVDTDDI